MTKKRSVRAEILMRLRPVAIAGVIAMLILVLQTGCGKTAPPDNAGSAPGASSSASGDAAAPGGSSGQPDVVPSDSKTGDGGSPQIGDSGMDNTDLAALIAKLPDKEALAEMHSLFSGYWITGGDTFVGFVDMDGAPGIYYGLYQTSSGGRGVITSAGIVDTNVAALTVKIPAIPEDQMDGPQPERTVTVYVDISNYNDNRLNIKIEGLAGGEWHAYEYGGGSLEDAFGAGE